MSKQNQRPTLSITDEMIAARAYELWQSRGCPDSDGSEDWQAAKSQLEAESQQHHLHPEAEAEQARRGPLRRLFARMRQRAAM